MTCLKSIHPASATVPIRLTLTHPLSNKALFDIEYALIASLAKLGCGLFGADPWQTMSPADAGDLEYASWFPDPGATEVASWATHMGASAR